MKMHGKVMHPKKLSTLYVNLGLGSSIAPNVEFYCRCDKCSHFNFEVQELLLVSKFMDLGFVSSYFQLGF